jgi:hypothetical protein
MWRPKADKVLALASLFGPHDIAASTEPRDQRPNIAL